MKLNEINFGRTTIKWILNLFPPLLFNRISIKSISEDFKQVLQDKISLEKFGEPNDVANAVLFLSSSLSDYITGETIHVNGGMYFS